MFCYFSIQFNYLYMCVFTRIFALKKEISNVLLSYFLLSMNWQSFEMFYLYILIK